MPSSDPSKPNTTTYSAPRFCTQKKSQCNLHLPCWEDIWKTNMEQQYYVLCRRLELLKCELECVYARMHDRAIAHGLQAPQLTVEEEIQQQQQQQQQLIAAQQQQQQQAASAAAAAAAATGAGKDGIGMEMDVGELAVPIDLASQLAAQQQLEAQHQAILEQQQHQQQLELAQRQQLAQVQAAQQQQQQQQQHALSAQGYLPAHLAAAGLQFTGTNGGPVQDASDWLFQTQDSLAQQQQQQQQQQLAQAQQQLLQHQQAQAQAAAQQNFYAVQQFHPQAVPTPTYSQLTPEQQQFLLQQQQQQQQAQQQAAVQAAQQASIAAPMQMQATVQ
jgi:hypothetical protein